MNETHKGLTALVAGALTLPWGTIAFIVAIIYNLHLIVGWWWDRFLRDVAITKGWYVPSHRQRRKQKIKELLVAKVMAENATKPGDLN